MKKQMAVKIIDRYQKAISVFRKNYSSLIDTYETLMLGLICSKEFNMADLDLTRVCEMGLIHCLSSDKLGDLNVLSEIDDSYFPKLIKEYLDQSSAEVNYFLEMFKIREALKTNEQLFLNQLSDQNILNFYKYVVNLQNINRKGWIRRELPTEYYENDVEHTMQMLMFSILYTHIYKPSDIDKTRLYETVLVHDIGESIIDDMVITDKEHDGRYMDEREALKRIFSGLNYGDYFISLIDAMESAKKNQQSSKEGQLCLQIDRNDPILKAMYYENELKRDDLVFSFYSREEERGTFTSSDMSYIADQVKKYLDNEQKEQVK